MSVPRYVTGKEASQRLGVHQRTLHNWDRKGQIDTIRTPGNKRLYNVDKYLLIHRVGEDAEVVAEASSDDDSVAGRLRIIYARVSTHHQKEDLCRQIEDLRDHYPDYLLIKDIGSGVNLNRRGLRRIIDLAIQGHVEHLVVSHKDRLARFGYELIHDLIRDYSGGTLEILHQSEALEPEEELAQDVLGIMNVFVARMNGLRKYRKKTDSP